MGVNTMAGVPRNWLRSGGPHKQGSALLLTGEPVTPVRTHDGTATDARGATINVGDIVTYVTGGRYPEIMTAEVLEIKVKVKLGNRDFLNRNTSWKRTHGQPDGGTSWVDGHRAIVVESLPFVDGRQNTRGLADA